jgi:hypothetical protein
MSGKTRTAIVTLVSALMTNIGIGMMSQSIGLPLFLFIPITFIYFGIISAIDGGIDW